MYSKKSYKSKRGIKRRRYLKGRVLSKLRSGTYLQRRFAPPVINGRVAVAMENAYKAAEQAAHEAVQAELRVVRALAAAEATPRSVSQLQQHRGNRAMKKRNNENYFSQKKTQYNSLDRRMRISNQRVPKVVGDGDYSILPGLAIRYGRKYLSGSGDYELLEKAYGHVKDAAKKGLTVAGDHLLTVGKAAAMEALRRGVFALI